MLTLGLAIMEGIGLAGFHSAYWATLIIDALSIIALTLYVGMK